MVNIGQKTILLLDISQSDAGSFSKFICGNVNFLKACDVSAAVSIMKSSNIDLVLVNSAYKAELIRSTEKDPSVSSVPVISVERGFAVSDDVSDDIERCKGKLFESGSLFGVLKSIYPLAVTCNLSKNTCNIIQYEDYSKDIDSSTTVFSELVSTSASIASPAHRVNLIDTLSVDNLCHAITNGDGTVRITYRSLGNDNDWHWFETIVLNIENPYDSDILVVLLSRIVDEQKNLEEHLLKTLDETTEELEKKRYYEKFAYDALPVAIVMYYLDWRPIPYINGNLFLMFGYSAEEVAEMHKNGLRNLINQEDIREANAILRKASDEGVDRLTLEYRMYKKDGSTARVQEIASRFVDEDGSVGFISVFTDITERYEMLEQLRRNEKIMSMVGEHSDRIVYYYDFAKDVLRAINVEVALSNGLTDHCYDPINTLFDYSLIHPDSVGALNTLIDMMNRGDRNGDVKLHINCLDDTDRWFDTCFTAMPDDNGNTVGAVISLLDVTEQHDHEISHARYMDTINNAISNKSVFLEIDLNTESVEKQIGIIEPYTESFLDKTYAETVSYLSGSITKKKQQRRVDAYLSKEMLLEAYNDSQRIISDNWPVALDDNTKIWIHCSVQLVKDPYTEHIKLLMTLNDVTESMLKQLNIIHKAENDGLTGLYNRSTIEQKIKESLDANYKNSVFMLIDLDDLKYINDTLGHAQGDRAICAISDELISTFKGIGMEGRLGGDEFLVFIPNLSESESIDNIASSLLRRLTAIKIGENDDNCLHCSMGISIADDDAHDFASLYKRADMALYHVKQNGKNDFASFTDEMSDEDFRYKSYSFSHFKSSTLLDNIEFRRMMSSLAKFYPQILLSNLTKNTICVLEAADDFNNILPREGTLDQFVDIASEIIHPDYSEEILSSVSRISMLQRYAEGCNYLYFYCRLKDNTDSKPRYIAFIIIYYKNTDGDICGIALVRRATERPLMQDTAKLQKILEMSAKEKLEAAYIIDTATWKYDICFGASDIIPSCGDYSAELSPLLKMDTEALSDTLSENEQFEFVIDDGNKKIILSCFESEQPKIIMVITE